MDWNSFVRRREGGGREPMDELCPYPRQLITQLNAIRMRKYGRRGCNRASSAIEPSVGPESR